MDVIEVKNLTKKFSGSAFGGKDFVAVDTISFSLKEGEILGFLGANGAGKTTTIQMLLGTLTPTSGNIHIFGKDLKKKRSEILEQVNFSTTYTNLPWWLSVEENLNFLSYFYEIADRKKRIKKIVEIFRLEDIYKMEMTELSAGQLTKVNLAKAMINYPKVLLLDEPTASLDVEIAAYIREFLLVQRKNFQISILLTSHNMSEVEELCDRVIVINKGKIIANDTPSDLAKLIRFLHIDFLVTMGMEKLLEYCKKKKFTQVVEGKAISITVPSLEIAHVIKDISTLGINYSEISIEKPSLEDYFLETLK